MSKSKKPSGISRREFVNKSLAASAGISIVPSFAVSGLGHVAPSDKLNIVGVGVGGTGVGVSVGGMGVAVVGVDGDGRVQIETLEMCVERAPAWRGAHERGIAEASHEMASSSRLRPCVSA